MATTERPWVVEVNAGIAYSNRSAANWWETFLLRMEPTGRVREIKPACVVGGVYEVTCAGEGEATWLAGSMVRDHGLPRTAVRVKRARQHGGTE